jgi:hypothetical protein
VKNVRARAHKVECAHQCTKPPLIFLVSRIVKEALHTCDAEEAANEDNCLQNQAPKDRERVAYAAAAIFPRNTAPKLALRLSPGGTGQGV